MRFALRPLFLLTAVLLCASAQAADDAPAEALVSTDARIQLQIGGQQLGGMGPGVFEKGWRLGKALGGKDTPADRDTKHFRLQVSGNRTLDGRCVVKPTDDGKGLSATYTFTPRVDIEVNSLNVNLDLPVSAVLGGNWQAGEKKGAFPAQFGEMHLIHDPAMKQFEIALPDGKGTLQWTFPDGGNVLLQDNRKWGPTFSVRINAADTGGQAVTLKKGQAYTQRFELRHSASMKVDHDLPVTIVAGPDWVPLKLDLAIEPGSALDFSNQGFHDAPAGKHGYVIARPDGTFAFENDRDTPRRFYGVNFCFSAHYITHEQADTLAERLMRLGYNTIRVHHYEGELASKQPTSLQFNPEKLDQLDYLLAACKKRGLYLTTDLFVSRPVKGEDIGRGTGHIAMNTFKLLVPVHEGAWKNWKAFATNFLTHVNPHTGLSYAKDPALSWLCMINEGNFGNFYGEVRNLPEWQSAWNAWLNRRYDTREKLAAAWGEELKDGEAPDQNNVGMPGSLWDNGQNPRARDVSVFLSETERDTFLKMKAFLRDELGCKALLTNANGWTALATDVAAREKYDYVDEHFYIDHPHFLEHSWRLPSRSPNTSPIAGGATGGRSRAFTRLLDKPFTISEYNYSCPGRYRGVGGILTGTMAALQEWDALWRFAYSHSRNVLFEPGKMDYFNMATDPLGQAAERAAMTLYLRGDMKPAARSLALTFTPQDLAHPDRARQVAPGWHWTAWVFKSGTLLLGDAAKAPPYDVVLPSKDGFGKKEDDVLAALRKAGLPDTNRTQPKKNILESDGGQMFIDGPRDVMILNTPRTAGGFAPAGKSFTADQGGVSVRVEGTAATVWASALDDQPIADSKRLLVSHLTDLQNTEIRYAERARQTLLDWGKLPHLVRAGTAEVSIKLADADKAKVHALSTGGKRLGDVQATVKDGALVFTADVKGGGEAEGARMLYEIVVE